MDICALCGTEGPFHSPPEDEPPSPLRGAARHWDRGGLGGGTIVVSSRCCMPPPRPFQPMSSQFLKMGRNNRANLRTERILWMLMGERRGGGGHRFGGMFARRAPGALLFY